MHNDLDPIPVVITAGLIHWRIQNKMFYFSKQPASRAAGDLPAFGKGWLFLHFLQGADGQVEQSRQFRLT